MKILLLQIDGRMPNIALMRLAAHHRDRGDEVELRHAPTPRSVQRGFWDDHDRVYASLIFEDSRPVAKALLQVRPDAVIGGSGWDERATLEKIGVTTKRQDYVDYQKFRQSIGFTQRGCRFKCAFCKVPRMEGSVRQENVIASLWRGEPWPRELILLDNDFFGQPNWRSRIAEIREGGFAVSLCQGINARTLNDEAAEAIASIDYRSWRMTYRQVYTAWDNREDESTLFRGLRALVRYGVKPGHIMVYVLIGFDHATKAARPKLVADDFDRCQRLREFGCDPYPTPYVRTRELVGFQRWIVPGYDKRIPWDEWRMAGYEPRKLGDRQAATLF